MRAVRALACIGLAVLALGAVRAEEGPVAGALPIASGAQPILTDLVAGFPSADETAAATPPAPAMPRAVWPGSRVGGLPAPRMLQWLDSAPQVRAIQPWLKEAGQAHGVDPDLLKALIAVESRFDPQARSQTGALGLMQITPSTANTVATADEKRRPADERLLDPRTNINTGARVLADLIARFGRLDLALAAYNAGEGAVKRHGGDQPPPNTLNHVERVLALYAGLLQRRIEAAMAPPARGRDRER